MLHFFYIVRLAQQGFFSVISSSFPTIEIDAIVYLCDKLVGSSLFAVKDTSEQVRQSKHDDVFDLLRKLHSGSTDVIAQGYSTTFQQMKQMIYTLIQNSLSQAQQPSSELSTSSSTTTNTNDSNNSTNNNNNHNDHNINQQQQQQHNVPPHWPLAPPNAPPPTTQHCAPPVWLVVPFNSMIDMSSLSLQPLNTSTPSRIISSPSGKPPPPFF